MSNRTPWQYLSFCCGSTACKDGICNKCQKKGERTPKKVDVRRNGLVLGFREAIRTNNQEILNAYRNK